MRLPFYKKYLVTLILSVIILLIVFLIAFRVNNMSNGVAYLLSLIVVILYFSSIMSMSYSVERPYKNFIYHLEYKLKHNETLNPYLLKEYNKDFN